VRFPSHSIRRFHIPSIEIFQAIITTLLTVAFTAWASFLWKGRSVLFELNSKIDRIAINQNSYIDELRTHVIFDGHPKSMQLHAKTSEILVGLQREINQLRDFHNADLLLIRNELKEIRENNGNRQSKD